MPDRTRRQSRRQASPRGPRAIARAGVSALLVVALLMTARLLVPQPAQSADAEELAPPAVMHALESVPMSEAAAIGMGPAKLVASISGPTLRGQKGLPRVIYVGADFCPYCAAERWPLIVALSRFGRFQGLRLSHSGAGDVYPETATLTFHGSSYQSTHVEFTGMETRSNVQVNGQWAPLETPTPDVVQVFNQYNAPPYVSRKGAIPFIDVGNRFVFSASGYDPGLLKGQTQAAIAAGLSDPGSETTRAILGEANVITAAVCVTTVNMPSAVCRVPAIQSIVHQLTASH